MIIALDYDHTYTADPNMWDTIVPFMVSSGHEVIIVTARYAKQEPVGRIPHGIQVHYTERVAKRFALSLKGIKPDIWIDDHPEWIVNDTLHIEPYEGDSTDISSHERSS